MDIDLQIVEACLFASQKALSAKDIARAILELEGEQGDLFEKNKSGELWTEKFAEAKILELAEIYEKRGGALAVIKRGRAWKIFTKAEFAPYLRELNPTRKPQKLTVSCLETLAAIAYRQPISKTEIESIRGVSSDGAVQKLLDHELIFVKGRSETPGRPYLFALTKKFYEQMGLASLRELPNSEQIQHLRTAEEEFV